MPLPDPDALLTRPQTAAALTEAGYPTARPIAALSNSGGGQIAITTLWIAASPPRRCWQRCAPARSLLPREGASLDAIVFSALFCSRQQTSGERGRSFHGRCIDTSWATAADVCAAGEPEYRQEYRPIAALSNSGGGQIAITTLWIAHPHRGGAGRGIARQRPVGQHLVGTPKGRLSRLEKPILAKPGSRPAQVSRSDCWPRTTNSACTPRVSIASARSARCAGGS